MSSTGSQRRVGPARKLWRSWQDEVTPSGKVIVAALLLSGVGSVSVHLPIYQLFCGLVVLLVISVIAGSLSVPFVRVQGSWPMKVSALQRVHGTFTVKNRSPLPSFDVSIGFLNLPPQFQRPDSTVTFRELKPRGTIQAEVALTALVRGVYDLPPLRVFTTFPFNLFRIGTHRKHLPPLLVLPHYHPLADIHVPAGNRYQPGGVMLTSNVGESPEYIGNREFQPGDSTRRLDFRSWARIGTPVVREFQEEYFCRVALIVDTHIPRHTKQTDGSYPQLEAAISLAAAVADALSNGEYLIDIFAAGENLYVFRSGRHIAHFENILEILACVESCPANPFDEIAPAISSELHQVSTAVCILLDWDEAREQFVRRLEEAGCQIKILFVRDQELSSSAGLDTIPDRTRLTTQDVRDGKVDQV